MLDEGERESVMPSADGLSFQWRCPQCNRWNANRVARCEYCERNLSDEELAAFALMSQQLLEETTRRQRYEMSWWRRGGWLLVGIPCAAFFSITVLATLSTQPSSEPRVIAVACPLIFSGIVLALIDKWMKR